jgi:NTP pyrophosphatase (non-canonical NTP hydrolase)
LKRENYLQTLHRAIMHYGEDLQQIVAMEEMAELTQQISKMLRHCGDLEHLAEEIADVQIMLDQLVMIYGCSLEVGAWRGKKLERLRWGMEADSE